ncbi:hypothetical protein FHT39_002031 [Mitsuaria sp. BK045]|nr:hypothetical protein [Mitsuaria sp. BK041]MBB3362609.1 hypothetical protein [Mitsuaria sp. BK045]
MNSGVPSAFDAPPSSGVPASLVGPPPHPGISGSTGSRPAPKVSRRRRASGTSADPAGKAAPLIFKPSFMYCSTLPDQRAGVSRTMITPCEATVPP